MHFENAAAFIEPCHQPPAEAPQYGEPQGTALAAPGVEPADGRGGESGTFFRFVDKSARETLGLGANPVAAAPGGQGKYQRRPEGQMFESGRQPRCLRVVRKPVKADGNQL